jgi:hypothetical protein
MKNIVKLMMLLLTPTLFAADNSIYIDQAGDSSNINITQDGGGNQIYDVTSGSTSTDYATLSGDSQTIDIDQIGSGNILKMGIQSTVLSGVGVDLTYFITGSNSVATLDFNNDGQGTLANLVFDVTQTGSYNDLFADILGSNNSVIATATGGDYNDFSFTINADDVSVNAAISGGGGNTLTTNLTSDSGLVDVTSVGASNTFSLTQSGVGGTSGHGITLDVTGSSNSFTTSQSGAIDTTIDITSVGSNNTWSITTSD